MIKTCDCEDFPCCGHGDVGEEPDFCERCGQTGTANLRALSMKTCTKTMKGTSMTWTEQNPRKLVTVLKYRNIFHIPNCPQIFRHIGFTDRRTMRVTTAVEAGYKPCRSCIR